jgi:hypothetical protein
MKTKYQEHVDLFARIVLPEGLRQVAKNAWDGNVSDNPSEYIAICVCRWIAENPIVPTLEQCRELIAAWNANEDEQKWPEITQFEIGEWQRRMFLAPEEENHHCPTCGALGPHKSSWGDIMPGHSEQETNHPDSVIDLMELRMAEYSDWVHTNLQNLFDKKPLEPRLEWDKPGRKVFTYADVVKK